MPKRTRSLTPTGAAILGFLHRAPMTGWELIKAIEGSVGYFWNTTRSQVYAELKGLAAAGLLRAGAEGARGSTPYAITAGGRAAFSAWLRQDPGPELIRFPLCLRVFFCRHLDEPHLQDLVARYRAAHQARLDEYRALAASLGEDCPEGDAATLRLGMLYEKAVVTWLESLPWATPARRRRR